MAETAAKIAVYKMNGELAKWPHVHYMEVQHAVDIILPGYIPNLEQMIEKRKTEKCGAEQKRVREDLFNEFIEYMNNEEYSERDKKRIKRATENFNQKHRIMQASTAAYEPYVPAEKPANYMDICLSDPKQADYIEKRVREDASRRNTCDDIVRKSFDTEMQDFMAGMSGKLFQNMMSNEIMELFAENVLCKFSADDVAIIEKRIDTLNGETRVVKAFDYLVYAYKALELAGIEMANDNKVRKLLKAVLSNMGQTAHDILRNACILSGACPLGETPIFEHYIKAVNMHRSEPGYFQEASKDKLLAISTSAISKEKINPDLEPKISDAAITWKKYKLCGYHYPEGSAERKMIADNKWKGGHTNGACTRDKSVHFKAKFDAYKAAHSDQFAAKKREK